MRIHPIHPKPRHTFFENVCVKIPIIKSYQKKRFRRNQNLNQAENKTYE